MVAVTVVVMVVVMVAMEATPRMPERIMAKVMGTDTSPKRAAMIAASTLFRLSERVKSYRRGSAVGCSHSVNSQKTKAQSSESRQSWR